MKKSKLVLSFAGEKGGIGKSLLSGNVGAALARQKKKVCLIDLDPQSNLTYWFRRTKELSPSISDVLEDPGKLEEAIRPAGENLFLIPSNRDALSLAEDKYRASQLSFPKLRKAMEKWDDVADIFIIDTPPNLGVLTVMALVASDYVFLPILADFFSWQSLSNIKESIEIVQQNVNHNLKIGGIIINMYEKRLKLANELKELISKENKGQVLKACIRKNTQLSQCTGSTMDIFRYGPKSYGSEDFEKLGKEIWRIIKNDR